MVKRWLLIGALSATVIAVPAVLLSSDSNDGSDPVTTDEATPKATAVDAALAPLSRELASHYPVDAVESADLPRRPPIMTPQGESVLTGAEDVPPLVRATAGISAGLPNSGTGFVYRYESHGLAVEGAASFLGKNDPFNGVQGCGRTVFFTRSTGEAADRWTRAVMRFLEEHDALCSDSSFSVEE